MNNTIPILDITIPFLPPSVNKAYTTVKIKAKYGRTICKRSLSKEALKFKREAKIYLLSALKDDFDSLQDIGVNKPYRLEITLYINRLFNKTGKSKFKKIDASNYIKIVEDMLVDALRIDDSQFFEVRAKKVQRSPEGVKVVLWNHVE